MNWLGLRNNWLKTLRRILKQFKNIPNFNKEKAEGVCQHITGWTWTWKTEDLDQLCPKISPDTVQSLDQGIRFTGSGTFKKFQQNL